jgi:hypothetical protein
MTEVETNVFYDAFGNLTRVGDYVVYVGGGSDFHHLKQGVVEKVFKSPRPFGRDFYEVHIRFAEAQKGKPGLAKTTHPERIMNLGF